MENAGDEPRRVDAWEFWAEFQGHANEYEWLIEHFLESQGRILLTAREGRGKSLLSLQIAMQAAAGMPILGNAPWCPPMVGAEPAKLKVLLFDLEIGKRSMVRRLETMARALHDDPTTTEDTQFYPGMIDLVHRQEGLNFLDRRTQRFVLDVIRESGPQVIIFDPLYKMIDTDAVREAEIKPVLRFLDRVRREQGCGIILVHHLRKRSSGDSERGRDSSDVYGASILLRWPEVTIMMGDSGFTIEKDRDDYFSGQKLFGLRGGKEAWPWPFKIAPERTIEAEIEHHLIRHKSASMNELADVLGHHKSTIRKALDNMIDRGVVIAVGSGSRHAYELTDMTARGSGDSDN